MDDSPENGFVEGKRDGHGQGGAEPHAVFDDGLPGVDFHHEPLLGNWPHPATKRVRRHVFSFSGHGFDFCSATAQIAAMLALLPCRRSLRNLSITTPGRAVGIFFLFLCLAVPVTVVRAEEAGKVLHVVNRLTYGPAPGDLDRVAAMGTAAFIAGQLEPERIEEPAVLGEKLAGLPTESMNTVRLFREFGPSSGGGEQGDPESMRRVFDRAGAAALEAARARLCRAILSKRQLFELMVAFWCEHFNLGDKKGLAHLWAGSFEREAIRPHAMGRFLDLLAATSMHPAMLIARDNWKNVVRREGSGAPRAEIDPTYAAILIGHQTLGPHGPQKPEDVKALARILTGWRVGAARDGSESGGFYFDPELHDPTDKVFLGQTIKGSGVSEGVAALRILAGHPATAVTISRKLVQYFLCDEPPASLVSRLAKTFSETDGDIREVLRALFSSPEFFDPKYMGKRFKSPVRQAISAVRATGAVPADTAALAGVLVGLGQPLFAAGGPEGYPAAGAAWIKPEGVARRISLAGDLVSGRLPALPRGAAGLRVPALAETLGSGLSAATRAAAAKAPGNLGAAVLLASPDFMRY